MESQGICREGFLTKRGGGWPQKWQSRYFVLQNSELCYFKNMADTDPAGKISLKGATLKLGGVPGRTFAFQLRPEAEKRDYQISAQTRSDMDGWVTAIQKAILTATHFSGRSGNLGEVFSAQTSRRASVRMSLPATIHTDFDDMAELQRQIAAHDASTGGGQDDNFPTVPPSWMESMSASQTSQPQQPQQPQNPAPTSTATNHHEQPPSHGHQHTEPVQAGPSSLAQTSADAPPNQKFAKRFSQRLLHLFTPKTRASVAVMTSSTNAQKSASRPPPGRSRSPRKSPRKSPREQQYNEAGNRHSGSFNSPTGSTVGASQHVLVPFPENPEIESSEKDYEELRRQRARVFEERRRSRTISGHFNALSNSENAHSEQSAQPEAAQVCEPTGGITPNSEDSADQVAPVFDSKPEGNADPDDGKHDSTEQMPAHVL